MADFDFNLSLFRSSVSGILSLKLVSRIFSNFPTARPTGKNEMVKPLKKVLRNWMRVLSVACSPLSLDPASKHQPPNMLTFEPKHASIFHTTHTTVSAFTIKKTDEPEFSKKI